jgi:hypothetical protein
MTRKNFGAAIRILARQKPFIPYSLELANDERLDVNHSEAIDSRNPLFLHLKSGRIAQLVRLAWRRSDSPEARRGRLIVSRSRHGRHSGDPS